MVVLCAGFGPVAIPSGMDLNKIIADVRLERDQLSEAIVPLERLGASGQKRRGRPPAWLTAVRKGEADAPRRRGRPSRVSGE